MYKVDEYDAIMSAIDSISAEPIDDTPYNIVANPKPVVESVADFNGVKIDTSKWSTGNGVGTSAKKVGAAKTTSTKKVDQVTENITTSYKKDDGKVIEVDADPGVKTEKAPKAGDSSGSFDSVAKSAQKSQEKGAESHKKFFDGLSEQTKAELFRGYIKSFGVDSKSKDDADKVLAKFDEITKRMKKA